jgi:hypothetical protein
MVKLLQTSQNCPDMHICQEVLQNVSPVWINVTSFYVADTWVDLPRMLGLGLTQPDKIHIKETDDPQWAWMMKLLAEMDSTFEDAYNQWKQLLQYASTNSILSSVKMHLVVVVVC